MVIPRAPLALRGVPDAQLAIASITQGHLEDAEVFEESSADRGVPAIEVEPEGPG